MAHVCFVLIIGTAPYGGKVAAGNRRIAFAYSGGEQIDACAGIRRGRLRKFPATYQRFSTSGWHYVSQSDYVDSIEAAIRFPRARGSRMARQAKVDFGPEYGSLSARE
ncbi:MAG: hypothetical protein WDO72_02595 [Pseudomonadota bacterium]